MEKQKLVEIKYKIKNANVKKIIKVGTLTFGFILIAFISFFDLIFDFTNFNWQRWAAKSAVLVGIMIFGVLMGGSVANDTQKEKVNGLYQKECKDYNDIYAIIEPIKMLFSQFWLQYKAKKLVEKKIDYLIDNQFELRYATLVINNIEKQDFDNGFEIDDNKPNEKIYVKEICGKEFKIKKCTHEQAIFIKNTFLFSLDTYGDSYFLSLYDDGDRKVNEAEKGKYIAKKIRQDKINGYLIKIASSLVISIVLSALTVQDFTDGDPNARHEAWTNLLARLTALITSYVSGYSTGTINVKDQARAIENKVSILKDFKTSYDNKTFIYETYEEMIEREYQEQLKGIENNNQIIVEQKPKKKYTNNAKIK